MARTLYLFSSGRLERKDNTLHWVSDRGEKYIPITAISDIKVFGEIELNKRLLEFLDKNDIPVHFFNYYGYYIGTFYPRNSMNSGLITIKQTEHYIDIEKRLYLAKSFAIGSFLNILKNLKYYQRRHEEKLSFTIEYIEEKLKEVGSKKDILSLMQLEGDTRKTYYESFNLIIEGFRFEKRTKNPPKNPLNAMISFGNALLYTTVLSEIYRTHLDPRIGYLHETNQRSFTLNLDIAEVFKPIIVDRVIFQLINKKQIQEKHFEQAIDFVHLNEKGREIFVQTFEEKLKTTIKYKNVGDVSYRRLIRMECYKLYKHFLEEDVYRPFVSEW
jgi:CRISPR-associated protein Cas1